CDFTKYGTTHPIWNYFEKLEHVTGFQQPRAKCFECNYEFNEATKPAKKHFKICQLVSNNKHKEYAELEKVYKTTNKKSDSNIEPILSTTSSRTSRQSVINFAVVDCIMAQEQKALELKFASSIYQYSLVLSLSELQPIIDLWKQARPAFKLPSRRYLSTTLLDKVYNETKKEVQLHISSCNNLCLIFDESYEFDKTNEIEIGIWEDSDFDLDNTDNLSDNEYNSQESDDEKISSSDTENFSDTSDSE
ncbi:5378_t:CDS:2, partial [Dentiscutata erythropus]